MKVLAFASLLLLCAGCAVPVTSPLIPPPASTTLGLAVENHGVDVGACGGYAHEDIAFVDIRLTNPTDQTIGPADYDLSVKDWQGRTYPTCPQDEVSVPGGASRTMRIVIPLDQKASCVDVREVLLHERVDGAMSIIATASTGFPTCSV